jgi:hypothetical protein
MQASDPLNPRAVLGAVKAQPGNAGASRKPSATAGLDRPARDAIEALRVGTKKRPWPERRSGLAALSDRSRRPVRYANQLPQQVEGLIVRLKAEKPHWGARRRRHVHCIGFASDQSHGAQGYRDDRRFR